MSDVTQTKSASEKFCTDCGSIINVKAEICPKCGVRQLPAPSIFTATTSASGRSRLAAILFAFFLGGLGVHKFYLGQIGWGVVYLLFCWTFIPAIVAFIEAIIYLTMSDDAFHAKFG
jgi:TM2 domain-containing membrane protein YozV